MFVLGRLTIESLCRRAVGGILFTGRLVPISSKGILVFLFRLTRGSCYTMSTGCDHGVGPVRNPPPQDDENRLKSAVDVSDATNCFENIRQCLLFQKAPNSNFLE